MKKKIKIKIHTWLMQFFNRKLNSSIKLSSKLSSSLTIRDFFTVSAI